MRRLWRDLIPLGLLLLLPLLLFAPVSVGDKTLLPADALYLFEPFKSAAGAMGVNGVHNPLLADLILENYAWKEFLVTAVESRTLPLWDPHIFAGHPFLANGQHSALYPLTWLFFILPVPRAFGAFVVLQLGLAGVWMYVLGRVLGIHPWGACVAGVIFQLSGFMVVSVVHPMIIAGASWLPLLLALIEMTVTRRRFWARERAMLPWALLGGIALGLQILAGHAETTYFVLLVMAGFAGWRLLYRLIGQPRTTWQAEVLSPAVGLLLMVALGLTLGAVQLLPLYEVAQTSFRQGAVTFRDVLGWAYPKRRLITFLMPDFFGNPTHHTLVDVFTGQTVTASLNAHGEAIASFDWGIKNYVEGGAYLGILTLLFAALAVIDPARFRGITGRGLQRVRYALGRWLRHPHIPFFTVLSAFSLACIFGTPLYALVYALPFLNQSHSPFRWVFPLTVAMAALAGFGVDAVAGARRRELEGPRADRPGGPRGLRLLLLGASPNAVSVLGALAIWGGLATGLGTLLSRLAFGHIEGLVTQVFWSMAKASYAFPDPRAFYAYLYPQFLTFAGFLTAGGIVLRVSQSRLRLPRRLRYVALWQPLALLVLVVDLVAFGAGFNPAVDPALLTYRPPVVDFLKQDQSPWRLSTFDPHGRKTFDVNTGMFYGLQDVRGYDSLFSAQYARYMSWIEPQSELLYNRIAPFTQFSSLDSPLTDLLNVKYVVTEEEIPLPKYQLVYEDEAVRVYRNLGVSPRAFTLQTSATVIVPDASAVGDAVLNYDPRFFTIIEEAESGWLGSGADVLPAVPADPVPGAPTAHHILDYSSNEVTIEAWVETPSWLVLADSFASGWKAFVRPIGAGESEEREVPIARVAGNFRGVVLDESAIVRFKYTPNSVKIGAFVSFLGGMVVAFLAVIWTWRVLYQDREEQTTVQRLAKNSIAPIALTLFNKAVEFAFAALMLRLLGPKNAGDYYYAISIFIWFDIVTNFGLNTYLTREVARHPEQARPYLINTTLVRLVLSLVGIPLLLSFIGVRQTLIARLTAPAAAQVIWAMLLLYIGLIPNSISTGLTALFYAYERAEYPAAITSVATLVKVTLQTLVLVIGWGIVGLAGAAILVNVVTLALLGFLAWRQVPALRRGPVAGLRLGTSDARHLRRAMIYESWPLMLNHLLAHLFFKIDIFLMEPILGSETVGLYSIGYKLLDSLMVIPSMFTLALFPVISRHAEEDREAFARFYRLGTKLLIMIVLPAALITTVAAREMVLVLGGAEYLPEAAIVLRLVAWSMPFGWINSITQYVLIALGEQRYLTRAYALGFAFSLGANLIFMPLFGYRASAILHILSELLLMIPFLIGVRRKLGTVGWWQILGKPLVVAIVSGVFAVALLALGRGPAIVMLLIAYPLLAWRFGVLTEAEQRMLAPLFQR